MTQTDKHPNVQAMANAMRGFHLHWCVPCWDKDDDPNWLCPDASECDREDQKACANHLDFEAEAIAGHHAMTHTRVRCGCLGIGLPYSQYKGAAMTAMRLVR